MTRQAIGSACRIIGILALIVGAILLYPLTGHLRFDQGSIVVQRAMPWIIAGAILIIAGTVVRRKDSARPESKVE